MGVFGRTRRTAVAERPRQPVGRDVPMMLGSTSRRQSILESYMELQQHDHVPSRYWRHDAVAGRAPTGRLDAFDGIRRFEYEGARHHRKREVKSDVDKERAQDRALHAPDSNRCAIGAPDGRPPRTQIVIPRLWCAPVGCGSLRSGQSRRGFSGRTALILPRFLP